MGDLDADHVPREDTLAPFVRNGRLLSYPKQWTRRMQILRWLSSVFEAERIYSEAEVNRLLEGHEIDHVTLRRYLVDVNLLARADGRYWLSVSAGDTPEILT